MKVLLTILLIATLTTSYSQSKNPDKNLLGKLIENPIENPIKTPPLQTIQVNLSQQTLTALENGKIVFHFPCSTGKNNGTPSGAWPIKEKVRHNRSLPQYGSVPIPFSLRLNILHQGRKPRIAIHAHQNVPRTPASHGCIRLKYPDAETLFKWANVGTIVQIQ